MSEINDNMIVQKIDIPLSGGFFRWFFRWFFSARHPNQIAIENALKDCRANDLKLYLRTMEREYIEVSDAATIAKEIDINRPWLYAVTTKPVPVVIDYSNLHTQDQTDVQFQIKADFQIHDPVGLLQRKDVFLLPRGCLGYSGDHLLRELTQVLSPVVRRHIKDHLFFSLKEIVAIPANVWQKTFNEALDNSESHDWLMIDQLQDVGLESRKWEKKVKADSCLETFRNKVRNRTEFRDLLKQYSDQSHDIQELLKQCKKSEKPELLQQQETIREAVSNELRRQGVEKQNSSFITTIILPSPVQRARRSILHKACYAIVICFLALILTLVTMANRDAVWGMYPRFYDPVKSHEFRTEMLKVGCLNYYKFCYKFGIWKKSSLEFLTTSVGESLESKHNGLYFTEVNIGTKKVHVCLQIPDSIVENYLSDEDFKEKDLETLANVFCERLHGYDKKSYYSRVEDTKTLRAIERIKNSPLIDQIPLQPDTSTCTHLKNVVICVDDESFQRWQSSINGRKEEP